MLLTMTLLLDKGLDLCSRHGLVELCRAAWHDEWEGRKFLTGSTWPGLMNEDLVVQDFFPENHFFLEPSLG